MEGAALSTASARHARHITSRHATPRHGTARPARACHAWHPAPVAVTPPG
jgi:hypothetical protein